MIHEMLRELRWQSEKMIQLEKELIALKAMLQTLHTSAKTNVEKIEYNFEQLKVESLDGTLIIGIRPTDAGHVDEMWVKNQHSEEVPLGTSGSDRLQEGIRSEIYQYIRDQVPSFVEQQAGMKRVRLSADEQKSIVEDMIRQTDERITFYLQQAKGKESVAKDILHRNICEQLKSDIGRAVDLYVEHFRKDEES